MRQQAQFDVGRLQFIRILEGSPREPEKQVVLAGPFETFQAAATAAPPKPRQVILETLCGIGLLSVWEWMGWRWELLHETGGADLFRQMAGEGGGS